MKTNLQLILMMVTLIGSLGAGAAKSQAQPSAHYVPGCEGVMAASLPPPGIYILDYNALYTSGMLRDRSGADITPANFNSTVYANVPRVVWITKIKVLGGNLGFDGLVPLEYKSLKMGSYSHSSFGVSDPFAEATISWHLPRFDFALGTGTWFPVGEYSSKDPTAPGLGYWTPMQTFGVTGYLDKKKTWAVSVLGRFEVNTEQRETHKTYGDALTFDWGINKTLTNSLSFGLAGYYQRQVTRDSDGMPMNQVAAIGPEIGANVPWIKAHVSLRYGYEFGAENRAEGHSVLLTLVKAF